MALPPAVETPRLLELRAIVDRTAEKAIETWPQVTQDDYATIGEYLVLFAYIDLNLRRIVEAAAGKGLIVENKTKARDLKMDKVENAIQTLPGWPPVNKQAMGTLKQLRQVRNLLAHFGVKRFPNDDAYLFLTKSAEDFRKVFDTEPTVDHLMFSVVECHTLTSALAKVRHLEKWISLVAPELVRRFHAGDLQAGDLTKST